MVNVPLSAGRKLGPPDVPAVRLLLHRSGKPLPGVRTAKRTDAVHAFRFLAGVTFQQRQLFFYDRNCPLNNSLSVQYSGRGNSEYSINS